MIDRVKNLAERIRPAEETENHEHARLGPLWLSAAQLLLATGATATIEQFTAENTESGDAAAPLGLTWAPVLIAPLAAAAHLEHARHPTERSHTAVRFLTGASVGFGAALFVFDAVVNRNHAPRRIGPLAFASAGLLGFFLEQQDDRIAERERALERRARLVERLVPRRRTKLDRIVVHV